MTLEPGSEHSQQPHDSSSASLPPLRKANVRVSRLTDVNPPVVYLALVTVFIAATSALLLHHHSTLTRLGHALVSPFGGSPHPNVRPKQDVANNAPPNPLPSAPPNRHPRAESASNDLEQRRLAAEQQRTAELRTQAALQKQQADAQLANERELREEAEAQAKLQRQALEDAERAAATERTTRENEERAAAEREAKQRQEQENPRPVLTRQRQSAPYTGPRFGTLHWRGEIHGTELVTIENGHASIGTVTGSLPGVPVLIQPVNNRKVGIASSPGPNNNFQSMVIRVSGNGLLQLNIDWNIP